MRAKQKGLCPHCRTVVRFEPVTWAAEGHSQGPCSAMTAHTPGGFMIEFSVAGCPSCGKPVMSAHRLWQGDKTSWGLPGLIWPQFAERPIPVEVDAEAPDIAEDFREAVSVLPWSKKASAALSRRCLQQVLLRKAGVKKRDLADQIDEVMPNLPTHLAENIDAIRQVGNFAAHPSKSTSTGEIVAVEQEEAEWLIEVLEELFEYFFVAPARSASRRQTLNQKLADIKKQPLKTPSP
jgi:hypothetical protein